MKKAEKLFRKCRKLALKIEIINKKRDYLLNEAKLLKLGR